MSLLIATWLALSGMVALSMLWLAWKRRSAPGALAFVFVMLDLAWWSFADAAYWCFDAPGTRAFWLKMAYVGVVFAPVTFFVLMIFVIRREGWLGWKAYLALVCIPWITLFVLWVDPLSGLFFGEGGPIAHVTLLDGGPWFYLVVFYSYLLVGTGVFLLGRVHLYSPVFYVRQTRIFLVAAILPWITNLLTLLGAGPITDLDPTPIVFAVSSLLIAYGFWGYRMMDLVPIARDVLVENMEDAIVVVDTQGRIVDINPKALEYADHGLDLPFGRLFAEAFSHWAEIIPSYASFEGRVEFKLEKPPFSNIELRMVPLKDRQGRPIGRLAMWRDISARVQTEEQLRVFLHAMVQNPVAVIITDPQGRIEYVNPCFVEMTGYDLTDVRGKNPSLQQSGETPDDTYDDLWTKIGSGEVWKGEILNRKKNGELYWVLELIAPVLDSEGKATHFVAMQQDITASKQTEADLRKVNARLQAQLTEIENLHAQLREEAIRDGLTRLFNRRFMEETLDREISIVQRDPRPISVVMLDVDLFKSINDTYGHQAGDAVLQTLGVMLLENTRQSDIACRFGGDEMVVVMPGADMKVALSRAEEWRKAFSKMVFTFGQETMSTTLSLGVASFPDQARSPNELLTAADKALYHAKVNRNLVVCYDPATMSKRNIRSTTIR